MDGGGGERGLPGMGHKQTLWSDKNMEMFYMLITWLGDLVQTLQTLYIKSTFYGNYTLSWF